MKNQKLMNVRNGLEDIKKLLIDTHKIEQIKDFYNYKGVEITHPSILVTDFNIKQSMSKDNLDWAREEHGIQMIDVILLKTFQLGFQQAAIKYENDIEEKEKYREKLRRANL